MIVAGVDVGNSTTEVAFARVEPGREPEFLLVLRAATTGAKGSLGCERGVRELVERGTRRLGIAVDLLVMAELDPVETRLVERVDEHEVDLGRAAIARPASTTPSGSGTGVGLLRRLDDLRGSPDGPAIAVISGEDFESAAAALRDARARGWAICGVLVGGDDAVLIGNRFDREIPIADEVAGIEALPIGALAAVEVAPAGASIADLSDPLRLATLLGLTPEEARAARNASRLLAGCRAGVVVRGPIASTEPARPAAPPGGQEGPGPFGRPLDSFSVPLPAPAGDAAFRLRLARRHAVATATLWRGDGGGLAEAIGARVIAREPDAAMLGAATTPGAGRTPFVIDLGAGTVDLHRAGGSVVVAGAGELVTRICGGLLSCSEAFGERAKRVRSARAETPFVLHHEDGSRTFLGEPAAPQSVGRLNLIEPAGLIPLEAALPPELWRTLRRAAKRQVLAANVRRAIVRAGGVPPGELVVLVGGCAVDREVVEEVAADLADLELVVARGDVLGRHGPRAAVAVGLVRAFAGAS